MVCKFCKHEECEKTGTDPQNDAIDIYECIKCYSDIYIEIFGSTSSSNSQAILEKNEILSCCHHEIDGKGGEKDHEFLLENRNTYLLSEKENT